MNSVRGRAGLLAVAAAAAAATTMLAGTATAHAACYGSTPSAAAYADPIDGEAGLAPEITTIHAGVDAACGYVVDPGIPLPLVDGDAVFVYIDTDGNPATGSPVVTGADVAIGTLGLTGTDAPPIRGVWNGATFAFTDPGAVGTAVGNGGFRASVDALPIAPGVLTQIKIASIYDGYYSYLDIAPNAGMLALPVSYSTVAPAPAPVAAPAPAPPTPRKVDGSKGAGSSCSVPATRGMTLAGARARVRAAGCTVAPVPRRAYSAGVRRGRVVGTSTTGGRVTLIVSKGRRPRRARSAAAESMLARLNALVIADQARAAG
jgi:hypothetical protein